MRVGTKSVLFGAHCFFIHPFFVAFGWWALGQFPWDPRLWAAFFLHDLGYLFSPNMDGPEGEEHVHLGAKIMGLLFGDWWADFTLRHSRYWAKRNGVSRTPSNLLMWAHYAEQHRGGVLGFLPDVARDSMLTQIEPVAYSDRRHPCLMIPTCWLVPHLSLQPLQTEDFTSQRAANGATSGS